MRRIAIAITLLALLAGVHACSSDAPGPTTPKGPGGGQPPTGTSGLQIRLFATDSNPPAGSCTLLQAIVTLDGVSVPDGTGVSFSTNFGIFQENLLNIVSVVTQNGAAVTALCATNPGTSNVRAQATSGGKTGSATITIVFQPSDAGPFFTLFSPSFGPPEGGTNLTINGGRFFGNAASTRVVFVAAGVTREALVTNVTDSAISLVTPAFPEALSPSVPVEIRVTLGTTTANPVTLSVPNCFAFGTTPSTQPAITAVLPSSGTNEGNTRVTIIGSGFQAPLQVFFGNTEAQVLSISFNQIVALTPPAFGAGGNNLNQQVDVRVRNVTSGVQGTLAGGFRYVVDNIITSVSPSELFVDQVQPLVTIFGQGFQAPVAVTLADLPVASIISVSATEIVVIPAIPFTAGCADLVGPVRVVNINTGDVAVGASIRYNVASTAPIISGVSPSSGPPGTSVTITGANFVGVTSVLFGTRQATITSLSNSVITVTAPDPGSLAAPACPVGTAPGTLITAGTAINITLKEGGTGCSADATGAFLYSLACVPGAELSLTKGDAPDPVTIGNNVTYSLSVSNAGPNSSTGVIVTDTLPVGTTFISCTPSQGTCGASGSTVTASLGTVASPGSATVSIVVSVQGPARTMTNTATVSSTTPDPSTTNNTATQTTVVQ